MKNIEFYYDELIKMPSVGDSFTFAYSNGLKTKKSGEISHTEYIKWLNEEHQLLDKKEKEYLSAVIKPFRNDVKLISKYEMCTDREFASIQLLIGYEVIRLPWFKTNTMYKGMKINEKYTLEELGL